MTDVLSAILGQYTERLALATGTGARTDASREDTRLSAYAINARDLSGVDYVYMWADGIHVNIRLEQERLCLLVLVGVRADGTKELIA